MDVTGIRGRHRYTLRTGRRASANLLLDQLEGLRESSFPDLAVSAYLAVPEDGSWGMAADALRDLAAERRPSLDAAQRAALDRELPALRRALEGDWRRCAAVVAIGHRPVRFVAGLPEPARAELAIRPSAALEQLEEHLEIGRAHV